MHAKQGFIYRDFSLVIYNFRTCLPQLSGSIAFSGVITVFLRVD